MLKISDSRKTILKALAGCSLLILLSSCAALSGSGETAPKEMKSIEVAQPFSDIPIPSGFKLDHARSFIYESGSGAVKVGKMYFSGWTGQRDTLAFYKNEMVNKGWNLINALEQETAVLNYEKEGWVSTVVIRSDWVGSQLEIQVGPK